MTALTSPFLRQLAQQGGIVSGGPVADDFASGWGKHPFNGEKAHHWTADRSVKVDGVLYGLDSACGLQTIATPRVPLLGAGSYEYCRRCEKKLMRAVR
jgi:hypothetical protein